MKTMSRLIKRYILFSIFLILVLLPSLSSAATLNYCQTPPFIVGSVKPNLLLMIDNSASMYDLSYIAGTFTPPPTVSCTGGGVSSTSMSFCYDTTYANATTYAGYFDPAKKYKYSETPSDNGTTPGANDKFTEASFPGSCYAGGTASYACINKSGTGTTADPYKITDFYATGNFLNWLSASKFDVQKEVLTGGKYDTTNSLLIGESRGCVGRRFVKTDTGVAGVTFAVRGPSATEPDYVNPETQGGLSRIEIYIGTNPNMADCQCAIANWTDPSGNYGQAQTDSKDCLNLSAAGATGNELATFNHSLQTCWLIKDNIEGGATTEATLFSGVNTQDLKTACTNAFKDVCGSVSTSGGVDYCNNNTAGTTADDYPVSDVPLKITNENSGNWICTGYLTGTSPYTHATPGFPYNAIAPDDNSGFLGKRGASACVSFSKQNPNKLDVTWNADDTCVKREILHYCYGAEVAEVVDPSEGAAETSTTGNIPSVLMDSAVRSLGTPAGTFYIRVQTNTKYCSVNTSQICTTDSDCPTGQTCGPTGLIQEFQSSIRFGAMSFNCIGSSTESATVKGTCKSGDFINRDGGKILHYIESHCSVTTATLCKSDDDCPSGEQCVSPVGDHSSGLIKTIDDVVAESWTPFAEGFYNAIGYFAKLGGEAYTVYPGTSRTDATTGLRINSTDFVGDKNPSQYKCQQNHVLLITDGMSTADQHTDVSALAGIYNDGDGQAGASGTGWTATCPEFAGSKNLDDLAWLAKNRNIRTFNKSSASASTWTCSTTTATPCSKDADCPAGETCLTVASEYITTRVVYTGSTSSEAGECNPATLMYQTALNGCISDPNNVACYQEANAANLKQTIGNALEAIAAQTSSGTAASVLASGEGSGANLIQALFFPKKKFDSTYITWIGSLKNLWYYLNPYLTNSIIMDDSGGADKTLNISPAIDSTVTTDSTPNDCSITFFTTVGSTVKAIKCGDTANPIDVDNISVLWEAGGLLHSRDDSGGTVRTIYTTTDGTTRTTFTAPANATMQTLLQATGNQNLADRIISYTRGTDYNSKFCSSTVATSCTTDSNCPAGETCTNYRNRTVLYNGVTKPWKLGDIISSTPKIVSWTPLNGYYKTYSDQSYKTFTESGTYTSRGMVFVGGNDGMLHAFKLGDLGLPNSSHTAGCTFDFSDKKACLVGSDLGKEMWAFIPKNALPYLKYMTETDYCHIYSVDATPYVFDASINGLPNGTKDVSSWRTILIGGMRLGGACKGAASTYGVQTPLAGEGYSSYFALDITDPTDPSVLWEFSHSELGFSTSGPAIVRIGDKAENGNWFVVFGSGPTGPIDTGSKQFMGFSDQPLKLFVFDVKLGPGAANANVTTITPSTAINYAFTGSLMGAPIDIHQNNPAATGYYQDDALYFGYTQAETASLTAATKWTKGGVLRLLTKENPDPAQWALSTVTTTTGGIIGDIGPVTAAVAKLQNYKYGSEALWLYFGTGRYYYKSSNVIDDPTNQQKLYGVKEPCFSASVFTVPGYNTFTACTTTVAEGSLNDADTGTEAMDDEGWYITLDLCTDTNGATQDCSSTLADYKAERVIAAPSASSIGAVFFTTAKPSSDICAYGGKTHLWAIDYDTGGKVSSSLLKGKALVQVSTGSIEQIDLSDAFTAAQGGDKDDRRSAAMTGLAVASPPVVVPPKAVKRTIHMRER